MMKCYAEMKIHPFLLISWSQRVSCSCDEFLRLKIKNVIEKSRGETIHNIGH